MTMMKDQPQESGEPRLEYRPQDRFGMAVAVATARGTVVADGPPRIFAFTEESVRFKLVNTTKEPVTFQFTPVGRDPFYEGARTMRVDPGKEKVAGMGELALRVRKDAALNGKPTRYKYKIHPVGQPENSIDPELDIYP
jgi:hypothetical protein